MNPELELILDTEILDEVPGEPDALLPEDSYHMKILRAGFYLGKAEIKNYQPAHMALFISSPDDTEVRRTGKQSCQQVFRPLADTLFNLSNVFLTELFLSSDSSEIDWHAVLTAESFNSSGREFMDSLQPGIDKGFIRYVMDILPNTWPDFLPKA